MVALFAMTLILHAPFASATQQSAEFEAASVKQNRSGQPGSSLPPPIGGRFTARNVTLTMLIGYAYHLQEFQLSNASGWMNSERYDVVGKAEGNAGEEQVRLMVQSLLAERFKLKLHLVNRDQSVYSLTVAKTGLKMPRGTDCVRPGTPTMPCGGFRVSQRSRLQGQNVPLSELVDILSTFTGQYVIHNTGLSGNYDIQLHWSPDATLAIGAEPGASPDDSSGATIFTALREQLGLELKSSKGPVPILVIESAQKLTPM